MRGTLSTLHSLEREQGRGALALKVDGGFEFGHVAGAAGATGAEWRALAQLAGDIGPLALVSYDMLLLRLNLIILKNKKHIKNGRASN
jgi:hypothetical protein